MVGGLINGAWVGVCVGVGVVHGVGKSVGVGKFFLPKTH